MRFCSLLLSLLLMQMSGSAAAAAVDFERQAVTIALLQEPPNLNSSLATDMVSAFILGHVGEGLVRYDRRGKLSPGVAESWQVFDDRIVFTLRSDAKWSDGSKVTAHDFVFSWRLLNDPATAAPYASIMYPIKNAKRVQAGELEPSALGVIANGDLELEVQLAGPCGYCVALMVHGTFFPIQARFYEAQGTKYAAEAENLLYNGPFKIASWTHDASLKMVKNEAYWRSDEIQLSELDVAYITSDNRTRLNLFRDNRLALARLGADAVADAVSQGIRLKTFVTGGMAYMRLNIASEKFTRHKKVRQAIQLCFDSDVFVNKVIAIPGYKPAYSFFPSWLNGVNEKFVDEYPVVKMDVDVPKARRLIQEVLDELGLDKAPPMALLTVTSPTGAKIAEYFQGMLGQSLGLDIKVDQQTFKQYLDKLAKGDFDLALSSWYPDFDDIVTYADLLASYNVNNRGKYNSAEYDEWLRILQQSIDPLKRMQAAAELQRIIIDDAPIFPLAETGSAYVQHPKLKGVVRRVLGADPDYSFARVVK